MRELIISHIDDSGAYSRDQHDVVGQLRNTLPRSRRAPRSGGCSRFWKLLINISHGLPTRLAQKRREWSKISVRAARLSPIKTRGQSRMQRTPRGQF